MRDYGHGLGAVHVTLASWFAPVATMFCTSSEWEYMGPPVLAVENEEPAPSLEFSCWVRLDRCTF